jgi:RecA/RadA recombinase
VCGLWYLPLQAAYAVAIVQRVARSVVSDLLNLDSWTAATINRRLTEQWAWDSLSPLLRASAEVTEQQDLLHQWRSDS